jgi:hypothetical protein
MGAPVVEISRPLRPTRGVFCRLLLSAARPRCWCPGPGRRGARRGVKQRQPRHCGRTHPAGPARPAGDCASPSFAALRASGHRQPRGLPPQPSTAGRTSPGYLAAVRCASPQPNPREPGRRAPKHGQPWMPINQARSYPIKRKPGSYAAAPHSSKVWLPPRPSVRLCTTKPARSINFRKTAESYIWLFPLATQLKYTEVC